MTDPFVFSTKANVLKFLQSKLRLSKIENIYDFTIDEWESDHKSIVSNIKSKFKNQIIVRSSAIGEDSQNNSMAGAYESILDVDSTNDEQIFQSIVSVIDSYKIAGNLNRQNQILIQDQTDDIVLNGVLFSRNEHTGSPYYTINYEESSSTTNVTHGRINNVLKIFRGISKNSLASHWKTLLPCVEEIEFILNNDSLDIEFGITKSNSVVIFQVRPITTIVYDVPISIDSISTEVELCKKSFSKFQQGHNIFSDMADWNPSEIIGSNPNLLDYSLYSYLIMDSVWHKGRIDLGYSSNPLPPLMIKFGNKPFVNVRASFDSLLPHNIPSSLKEKVTLFCLEKLKKNPHLHDKVEFEILFSCYDLNTDAKLQELLSYGFSNQEITLLRNELINFTNTIISNFIELYQNFENQISRLLSSRQSLLDDYDVNGSYQNDLEIAKKLLDDCISFGTIPFSSMARIAFISNSILRSLSEHEPSINQSIIMNSISTPLTQLCNDLNTLSRGQLKESTFLEKYGHLRPGTYDITAQRYDDQNPFFKNMKFLKISSSIIGKDTKHEINSLLENSPLDFSKTDFYTFLEKSIAQRESIKFFFTKNLSDALEFISRAASKLGFTRNEISNLDINSILKFSSMEKTQLQNFWKNKISDEIRRKSICNFLFMPSVITSSSDFEIIHYINTKPNFITNSIIDGEITNLDTTHTTNLENKIVLIENADPGYDWIFTKNPIGLITKYGGAASHMAIRCSEIGLPAAIGCGDLLYEKFMSSKKLLLDCENHRILVLESDSPSEHNDDVKKTLKSIGYIK